MTSTDHDQRRHRRPVAWWLAGGLAVVVGLGGWVLSRPAGSVAHVLGERFAIAANGAGTTSGAGNGNSGCGVGNGGGVKPGCTPTASHQISTSATMVGPGLAPGRTTTLRVTVVNLDNQDVQLTSVVPTGAATVAPAGCDPAWFTMSSYAGPAVTIAKQKSATVDLTIAMADTRTDQGACKSASISFPYRATVTG